jgi:hypothetical protein
MGNGGATTSTICFALIPSFPTGRDSSTKVVPIALALLGLATEWLCPWWDHKQRTQQVTSKGRRPAPKPLGGAEAREE